MRKEVKIALVVLGIILLVGIIVGIFLNSNKRNYELNLPQQEKLSSIVVGELIPVVRLSHDLEISKPSIFLNLEEIVGEP